MRWPEETSDVRCPNSKGAASVHAGIDQFACQRLCEKDPECVGIAITTTEKNSCRRCLNDVLRYTKNNVGFYRRPLGNNGVNST